MTPRTSMLPMALVRLPVSSHSALLRLNEVLSVAKRVQVLFWLTRATTGRLEMSLHRWGRQRQTSVTSGWIWPTSTWSRSSTSVLYRWYAGGIHLIYEENCLCVFRCVWALLFCSPVWELPEEILQIPEHGGAAVPRPSALQMWQTPRV